MRFPLGRHIIDGYTFMQPTSYSAHHLGTDYKADSGEPLYAPESGAIINQLVGKQGGSTIWLRGNSGYTYRFLHLQQFAGGLRAVKEGDLIGWCDNTGLSDKTHLHLDITKPGFAPDPTKLNQFVDPEKYYWEGELTMDKLTQTYSDLFARIWKILHKGQDPNFDSIQHEAKAAAQAYFSGERYAANAWVDAHFKEVGQPVP